MSDSATLPTDLDVAQAFGDAYARGDFEVLAGLLHPQVHEREITPHAYVDQTGPDAVVQEVADFLAPFGSPEIVLSEVEPVGSVFRWSVRWRLAAADGSRIIEWHAFLRVAERRVSAIDGVCSGLLPDG